MVPLMTDRLSALDVSFLYAEQPATPMHLGGVAVFDPPSGGFDHERFTSALGQRFEQLPRYRQKVVEVPFRLARPVWADDVDFDVNRHVRRVTLPGPGSERQLRDLVAQLIARPVDRRFPLWEAYVVDGLAGGRFALVHKVHHALVDGVAAMNTARVVLDRTPEHARQRPTGSWAARPAPGGLDLAAGALGHLVRCQGDLVSSAVAHARSWLTGPPTARQETLRILRDVAVTLRSASRARHGPLNVPAGRRRAFGMARTRLGDYQRIRETFGVTVNDVALASVTGALREWLARRGDLAGVTTLRALVPVSVRTADHSPTAGNRVSSYLVDLPVGESDPVSRLRALARARRAHRGRGQSVGVDVLLRLSGSAPIALYAVAARAVNAMSRHLFNLAVSNVRGPRHPLYADGALMAELFPVVPLAHGQGLAIGLVSYRGGVYYGLNADHDAVPDVEALASDVEQALDELVGCAR
jgi:diacylglycerol O-acyltransferase / wax synthase